MKIICLMFFSILLFTNCNAQDFENTITIKELKSLSVKENVQIVDVRTPLETKKGMVENAIKVNFFDINFTKKFSNKVDKTKPVYIYCKSGGRSNRACKILQKKGYKVYNVLGGYDQWKREQN